MTIIILVYMSIARGNIDLKVTKEEFLQATQSYAQITPYEVTIIYKLKYFWHCSLLSLPQRIAILSPNKSAIPFTQPLPNDFCYPGLDKQFSLGLDK